MVSRRLTLTSHPIPHTPKIQSTFIFNSFKMKMPKQKSASQLQREIDVFNSLIKVGDTVNVKLDNGDVVQDTIRYAASIMGGHTAMAWLDQRGSYLLERVTKVKP